jgi:hypothetical protein
MKNWSDLLQKLPVTYTAYEADEKREEIATVLKELAEAIESGEFNFQDFTLSIGVSR